MTKFKQIFDETYLVNGTYGAKWGEKRVFKFTWEYCSTCHCMFVRCPKCGNNCCNAGFGEVTTEGLPKEKLGDIGITCDVCNLAYQYQHLAWDTKMAPEPTDEMIKEAELQNKLYWEEIFGEDKI